MTTSATNPWLESLLAGHASVPRKPHAWMNELRAEALERANSLTLPSVRQEDWRFTDLSPLYELAFKPAGCDARASGWFYDVDRSARLCYPD